MSDGVFVLSLAGLVAAAVLMVRRRRPGLPRREFVSCWFQPDRIVAEGQARPAVLLYEHFTIEANGRVVEMVVMVLTPGGKWEAQDLVSLLGQRRVTGSPA